jgi:quercetin dioxygenase-like cupin family protein
MVGIGEARIDNVIYKYEFIFETDEERKTNKSFLESLITIKRDDFIWPIKLLRDPISSILPLKVKRIDELTMHHVASQIYMPLENLSLVSQKLYNSIGGKKFILDDIDFPDFSRAIEYSIATEGCWCNTILKEKASNFNPTKPNILETYLRITMGKNNGESPGQMLVMEIWPKGGHFSPIHSHANSEAIIRVLHGSINVSLFPYLSRDNVEPFLNANFDKGDVTWISPTLNQIHQLKNISDKTTCITIQCYSYDLEDITHYDYFDYIGENGERLQFEPDSDMDFVLFKKKMKEEWKNRPRNCFTRCFGL